MVLYATNKILIHGGEIIESAILPIGMLSVEARQARNKHIKKFREGHSRKFSRKVNIQDVLNLLLVTSDPVIISINSYEKRNSESLQKKVRNLLIAPLFPESSCVLFEDSEPRKCKIFYKCL